MSADDMPMKVSAWIPVSRELITEQRDFFGEMLREQQRRAALRPWERQHEDEVRLAKQEQHRRAVKAELDAAHERARFIASGSPTVVAVLELHAPVVDGMGDAHCEGCDSEGYETEWPTFPCRTYELITSTQPTT